MFSKTVFALFMLYIASTQAMTGGWTPYGSSNMNHDPDINKIISTSINSFAREAFQQKAVQSQDWSLQKVNSIEVQMSDSVKYKLNLSVKGNENKQLNVVLIANKDASTNEISLLSWEIAGKEDNEKKEDEQDNHSSANGSLRPQAISMNDERLLQELHVCLETLSTRENLLTLIGADITEIYTYLIADGSNFHLVTFKAQKDQFSAIIKVLYTPTASPDLPILYSYTILDHAAKYEKLNEKSTLDLLIKRLDTSLRFIDPKVFSRIHPPFLGAYTAKSHGQTLYYLSVIVQGSDHSLAHYEIWLSSQKDREELTDIEDLQLFGYARLDMSKETVFSQGDLSVVAKGSEKNVDCGKISSLFVCSVYPECTSSDFVSQAKCKGK